jgi:hypothetical protein
MRTILIEDKEYSCPDIKLLGTDERATWFVIEEEGHPLCGVTFGICDMKFSTDGLDLDYEFYSTKGVDQEELKPIIDQFLIVIMGATYEN